MSNQQEGCTLKIGQTKKGPSRHGLKFQHAPMLLTMQYQCHLTRALHKNKNIGFKKKRVCEKLKQYFDIGLSQYAKETPKI